MHAFCDLDCKQLIPLVARSFVQNCMQHITSLWVLFFCNGALEKFITFSAFTIDDVAAADSAKKRLKISSELN